MIYNGPPAVKALAKKQLSWSEEKGVWGVKGEWKSFAANVDELQRKWAAGIEPVSSGGDDDGNEMVQLLRSKLSHAQALDGKSVRSKTLNDCLLLAPALLQNLFVSQLGWDRLRGSFAVQDELVKENLLVILDTMSGKPAARVKQEKGPERLVRDSHLGVTGLVSLREEGVEEAHLLRGGSRFEGQSRLVSGGAGASLRQQDIRQGLGAGPGCVGAGGVPRDGVSGVGGDAEESEAGARVRSGVGSGGAGGRSAGL
mmetsp:Transcript_62463/g.129734  ORF Transcript_62463/g.129734 Transcript_62463/m.129734 type:complete len:256 (-) Transcript_62463:4772-5539(-)